MYRVELRCRKIRLPKEVVRLYVLIIIKNDWAVVHSADGRWLDAYCESNIKAKVMARHPKNKQDTNTF